jgi:parallel beta-helix repeat protein
MKRIFARVHPNLVLSSVSVATVVLAAATPVLATDVCGPVCDVTWNAAGSPYVLTCDVTVAAGCSLTVDAGVQVRVRAGFDLTVAGTLDVNGGSGNVATFTSDAATPAPGAWNGIVLQSSALATIDHALVEYAVDGVAMTGSASATLSDVAIKNNSSSGVYLISASSATLSGVTCTGNTYGIYVYVNSTAPPTTATGCTITGNQYGVRVRGASSNPSFAITGSSIHGNGSWDFYAQTFLDKDRTVLDATGNWWGTTDASVIGAKIYDHANDLNSPIVDWCDYLAAPGGAPARTDARCAPLSICGSEPVEWNATDMPYLLVSDAVVCETGTLWIGPDVTIRTVPRAGAGVEVLGRLEVNGTSGHEAVFRSDAATPVKGDWQGLALRGSGVGSIDHATISNTVDGLSAAGTSHWTAGAVAIGPCTGRGVVARESATLSLTGLTISGCLRGLELNDGSTATLADSSVSNQSDIGVYLVQNATVTLTNVSVTGNPTGVYVYVGAGAGPSSASGCTITGNSYGVRIRGTSSNPNFGIRGSSIHSNSSWNLHAQSFLNPDTQVIDATGNWWGTTETQSIRDTIYDRANATTSPLVDWCDYLDGPGGAPARTDAICAGLTVCGGTEVWDRTDLPYLVVSDVVVCPSGTLRIEDGVEVRVAPHPGAGIEVQGRLEVAGLDDRPVVLISDSAAPVAGDWEGLTVAGTGAAFLEEAAIAYVVDGLAAFDSGTVSASGVELDHGSSVGIWAEDNSVVTFTGGTIRRFVRGAELHHSAALTLEDVAVIDNTDVGVYVLQTARAELERVDCSGSVTGLYVYTSAGAPRSRVWGSRFTGNTLHGVRLRGTSSDPDVTITSSSIHSNTSYDLYAQTFLNAASTLVWAPDNWWGTTNVDTIRAHIYDREESATSPRVVFRPFGADCSRALAGDTDSDGRGDFEDNCPAAVNFAQSDSDGDRMGDACDPDVDDPPTGDCDGLQDVLDGHADSDADGWGDPCDFHPTRSDSYPGAAEACDGRDNDGDGSFGTGESGDVDVDSAITCGDCDDAEPLTYPCGCERCLNAADDDCDGDTDGADGDCVTSPFCVRVSAGPLDPDLHVDRNVCGGANAAGPFEVIRGILDRLQITGGSCDLGPVECVDGFLAWDRVTDWSRNANPACNETGMFYLARDDGDPDFGSASTGEPRDVMTPPNPCP